VLGTAAAVGGCTYVSYQRADRIRAASRAALDIVRREPHERPLQSPVMYKSRMELGRLRTLALQETAVREGIDTAAIEAAVESSDPKPKLIELIIAERRLNIQCSVRAEDHAAVELRRKLKRMRVMALQERAVQEGVDSGMLENAMDCADPKAALVELCVTVKREQLLSASGSRGAAPGPPQLDAASRPVSEVSSANGWASSAAAEATKPVSSVAEWRARNGLSDDSPVWTPDAPVDGRSSRADSVATVSDDLHITPMRRAADGGGVSYEHDPDPELEGSDFTSPEPESESGR